MTVEVLALAAGGIAGLGFMFARDFRREKSRRKSVFENCRGLLEQAELRQDGADFPVLSGSRGGWRVELHPLADTIQLRKLPVLWLLVTVYRPLPVGGVFDMMVRPANTEFYSPHGKLPQVMPTPAGWPEDAVLRSDRPEAFTPLVDRMDPHVAEFTADGRTKEILISPKGLRLVWRLDESQRGHYLVTRQPLFEAARVPRDLIDCLLDRVIALGDDLAGAA